VPYRVLYRARIGDASMSFAAASGKNRDQYAQRQSFSDMGGGRCAFPEKWHESGFS
jgi:hypothetical protein